MKAIAITALIGTVLAAGLAQSRAQTTNVVVPVNINLSGMAQTGDNLAGRVRITTKDVINSVGTFSTRAKLLAVFPDGGGEPHFIVRDGDTDTAVTSLAVESVGTSVDVNKTTASGNMTGNSATILHFVFHHGANPSFDVQGYTTATLSNRGSGHDLLSDNAPSTFKSNVNGTGTDATGNPAVLQGNITGGGRKVEIF